MRVKQDKRTEFDRQIECRDLAIIRVNLVFDRAIKDQVTHGEILDRLQHYVNYDEMNKRLTVAQREYVQGYVACRFDRIWREHIAWGFKPLGIFCATFEEVQEKYHDEILADRCNGFHYWKDSSTHRAFTITQP